MRASPGTVPVISRERFDAVILDMDGVVTDTARLHAAAWKRCFDEFLATDAPVGADTRAFTDDDYRRFVDGRGRVEGVEAFLASRGIALPRGSPTDAPGHATAWALANRKQALLLEVLETEPPHAFASSVAFLRAARRAGLRTAVVTASRNRAAILAAAGVADLFDAAVDGFDAERQGLASKPDPALFLEAARRLGVTPARAVVIEDALVGVEAARRGAFGLVIGVDRAGHPDALRGHGADVVVADLGALRVEEAPHHGDPGGNDG